MNPSDIIGHDLYAPPAEPEAAAEAPAIPSPLERFEVLVRKLDELAEEVRAIRERIERREGEKYLE